MANRTYQQAIDQTSPPRYTKKKNGISEISEIFKGKKEKISGKKKKEVFFSLSFEHELHFAICCEAPSSLLCSENCL